MIRSMTGFASLERQYPFGRLAWEMRSVNHRYLEFSIRLPEEFRVLEPKIRDTLAQYLNRGKIDATLRYHEAPGAAGSEVELNRPLAEALLGLHRELQSAAGENQPVDLATILRWPGVVTEQLPDPAPLHAAALELLDEAARDLQQARGREGAEMVRNIVERLDGIGEWVGQLRGWLPEIRTALREKMQERIAELQQPLDPGRLEQEVSFLAQKIDVDEELDRLDAHVLETRRALELDEPVGRRLDFLMQEFNRESNTISSKSIDPRTSRAAVELKVLIEQIREQVQNVE
ncbi:MAG: YicC family protein [Xanthomonadales bacterium]|nr:YicC family protein [Xanthomonadales bacterium]